LLQAGINQSSAVERFIRPRLAHLSDPLQVTHIPEAVERIIQAISTKEKVVVLGDYDVDGITSTVLMVMILRRFAVPVAYVMPRRMEEGYGMTGDVVARILEDENPQLLIVLDCGTNSVDEVKQLADNNVDVIIVDHHQSKGELPEAILVNPHVHDKEDDPWFDCCTVGLVFKLVHGLVKVLRQAGDSLAEDVRLKDFLDLVALGTIADLVPLLGENRIFSRFGLKRLSETENTGLRALSEASGLDLKLSAQPADVSFKLAPRINASGRLGDAAMTVEMFLGNNYAACSKTAVELNQLNRERQGIERGIVEEAEQMVSELEVGRAAYVFYSDKWHPGVVGIVAGKLSREIYRPCIVLGTQGDMAKGSARSIPGVNLVEAFEHCAELLENWGGHPMAAGVELRADRVDAFRSMFVQAVESQLGGTEPERMLEISTWLTQEQLTAAFFEQLECLHPFGQKNPQPTFGIRAVCLDREPVIFGKENGHIRFELDTGNGSRLKAIAWNQAVNPPPSGQSIELAVRLGWTSWRGRRFPQAELLAWREPE